MNRDVQPPPTEGHAQAGAPPTPVKILIVDDEPRNLIVLETILDLPGYELVRAGSGDEALMALVSDEFALLILDVRMPGMSGFDLAKLIQGRKRTAGIPIIFLTAYYNEDQHVLEGYKTGAVDYLQKPVNVAVLRSKVAVFVELYRKQREVGLANHALLAEVTERRRIEGELRALNETLDQRVHERTAELQESNRRKDEFLAILAHELRNPLAPVRNAVHVLGMKGAGAAELEWARDVIDRQTRHLSRLIDDLMDVSRITRGLIELRRQHVELGHVLQAAIEASRPVLEKHAHELVVALPPEPVPLDADMTRLTQVFLNLLDNAAKYTDDAGRIDLRAERHGEHVSVSVRDSGVGIAPDKLPLVFGLFSQVEPASSRSKGGLGIGLYLSRQIVELHGGSIEARSGGLGQGSEFVVRLPAAAMPIGAGDARDDSRSSRLPDLRILVADDNHDAAHSLTRLLEQLGASVRTVFGGEEAIAAAHAFRPHVVLCDLGMPGVNGFEACQRIRREPWAGDMVLIAVTGWGQAEDRLQTRAAGFHGHLVKPLEVDALVRLLADLNVLRATVGSPRA